MADEEKEVTAGEVSAEYLCQLEGDIEMVRGLHLPDKAEEAVADDEGPEDEAELWVQPWFPEVHVELFGEQLWRGYLDNSHNPAYLNRSYGSREVLLREWAVNGEMMAFMRGRNDCLALGALSMMDARVRSAWFRFLLNQSLAGQAGKGLSRTALRYFGAFANERYGIERLYHPVAKGDKTGREILESQGWKCVGKLPGYGYRFGEPHDAMIYTADKNLLLKYHRAGGAEAEAEEDGRGNKQQKSQDS